VHRRSVHTDRVQAPYPTRTVADVRVACDCGVCVRTTACACAVVRARFACLGMASEPAVRSGAWGQRPYALDHPEYD
jgi:hypothetical protein